MLRHLAAIPAVMGALLLAGTPALAAGPVDDAIGVLSSDSLFVHPDAGRKLDVNEIRSSVGDEPIKLAILPSGMSVDEVRVLPRQMAKELPGNTIAVISGRYFYAGSEVICSGEAGRAASGAINANEAQLDSAENSDITKALIDFVTAVKKAPECPTELSRGDRYADEPGDGGVVTGADDTATLLPWLIGGVAFAVVGVGTWVLLSRLRTRGGVAHRRDEAGALVARLAAELEELPDEDTDAVTARADAAAKHGEAEAILYGATTDEQFGAARHAALEGLTAAMAARVAIGRDPGQPVPPFDLPADEPFEVVHTGRMNQPSPQYVPGVSYFHAGSAQVPRGWYPEPFWQDRADQPGDQQITEPAG
jgi:hypothetical protein